ncbi:MAG: hypothetical protein IKE42_09870 [Aquamicrobium sp.]|uniref:DUF6105 family protein n=1 Tax=Mesorhizobium sp. Pch-S TaxID=2082387 RepID=UPI001012516C|nr:DUF6105 family protein [Mesorhizobium sp. Pch-S]MBR2688149.1 hypothetical protein [Aquamicrobium sp.]QAZ45998.1 hypothetical protein C1M53_26815 [Mesorhizobium sp. Pch-S]
MRALLLLWIAPLVLFWGWYFLSLNDMNFGYVMLSRQLHDLIFQLYGEMLGIDPALIPGMIAKACVFDSFLVAGIVAFRRRRQISAWWHRQRSVRPPLNRIERVSSDGPRLPAE